MIKVLQYYPILQDAGTEMVIMNWWKFVDHSKVHFDFLCRKEGLTSAEFQKLGSEIFYVDGSSVSLYKKNLELFFKSHPEYQIIHIHNCAEQNIVLKVAKKCGVKHRIIHSHVARPDLPGFAHFLKSIKDIPLEWNANHFMACSTWAIDWLFPHRKNHAVVMHNAIDLDKFKYSEAHRLLLRKDLGLKDDELMYLYVARFSDQKNHKFLLSVAEKVVHINPKIKFVLVGEGPLWQECRNRISQKQLQKHIILTGPRRDVPMLNSAADVFVCPSKYEGLGIVLIEAQSSGLITFSSDNVPPEADMHIGLYHSLPLVVNTWVQALLDVRPSINRAKKCEEAQKTAYNISSVARRMEDFYLNLA